MKCSGNGTSNDLKKFVAQRKALELNLIVFLSLASVLSFRPGFPLHILGREIGVLYMKHWYHLTQERGNLKIKQKNYANS